MERRSPRETALCILGVLFGEDRPDREGPAGHRRTHPLPPFQEAAVERLRGIIDRRGGAILADAVGLGKTYVALALVEERLRSGGDAVVVIPAALRGLWRPLLRRIGPELPWRLVSHAQMSRGVPIRAARGRRLVVVDEAHRFRNPATRRYGALSRLVAPTGTRPPVGGSDRHSALARADRVDVLLVTATPINNGVDDLYHLARLFLADDALGAAGVPSLGGAFETPDPAAIRRVVRELVVRRTRELVEGRFGGLSARTVRGADTLPVFPDRAPPGVHRYGSPAVREGVAVIGSLELPAYGTDGAAALLRLGLLKRLDSSPAALGVSLGRVREFLAAFRDAAAAGRLLRPGDRRVGGDDDPFQLLLVGMVAEPAPPELDLPALVAATERDLARLDRLAPARRATEWGAAGDDPKISALVELLQSVGDEKVLVFSEYRDTARAIWRALLPRYRVARIDGTGAWLGASPAGRSRVVERFAPVANGRPEPPERERVDVLVATDVLAEGLNLQDARHVVSYELPWNPVRLLQRIGRADRLGSPHADVVPHLFVPADGLDAVLGLTRRLRGKLHGIATTLGEEQADELLQGLASGRSRIDAALRAAAEGPVDPVEELRTLWVTERRAPGPHGAGRGPVPEAGSLAACRGPCRAACWTEVDRPRGVDPRVVAVALAVERISRRALELLDDGAVRDPTRSTVRLIAAALEARGAPEQTEPFREAGEADETDEAGEARRRLDVVETRVRRDLEQRRLVDRAPARLAPGRPVARLARRLRNTLAAAGAGVSPEAVRRADALLAALARPLPPERERVLGTLLDGSGTPGALAPLLDSTERALGVGRDAEPAERGPGVPAVAESGSVRAVILVRDPVVPRASRTG